jgi:hypothetical protein
MSQLTAGTKAAAGICGAQFRLDNYFPGSPGYVDIYLYDAGALGAFSAQLEVSYDGGSTWVKAPPAALTAVGKVSVNFGSEGSLPHRLNLTAISAGTLGFRVGQ